MLKIKLLVFNLLQHFHRHSWENLQDDNGKYRSCLKCGGMDDLIDGTWEEVLRRVFW